MLALSLICLIIILRAACCTATMLTNPVALVDALGQRVGMPAFSFFLYRYRNFGKRDDNFSA